MEVCNRRRNYIGLLLVWLCSIQIALAFQPSNVKEFSDKISSLSKREQKRTLVTHWMQQNDNNDYIRTTSKQRTWQQNLGMFSLVLAATTLITTTTPIEPASATYSAYVHREQDWQERVSSGSVQVKTAKDLRRQLAEIAPMNSESSKIFCPNGPSANVSPLMENKCNDRLAIPSVYGRSEDIVGNSIPGFNGGFYGSNMRPSGGSSSNLAAELGNVGYGFTSSGKK